MNYLILLYGGIAGVVIIGSMIFGLSMAGGPDSPAFSEWLGYLIMLVGLSLIFVGIKQYRDRELGGTIRFGTALLVGLGISAVASVIYVAAWEVYLAMSDHAFIHTYTDAVIAKRTAEGISDAERAELVASMDAMKEKYGNPWYRLPITFTEIFPMGLIVSLISAAILRRRG